MNPGIRIKLSFNFTDWLEFVQFVYTKLNISRLNKHQKLSRSLSFVSKRITGTKNVDQNKDFDAEIILEIESILYVHHKHINSF